MNAPLAQSAKRTAAVSCTTTLARLLTKSLGESLSPLSLAPAQFVVLRELWLEDGCTQSGLARALDVEQATMSNTLKRMVRDGLIRYEPHPQDTRARRVHLTERGVLLEEPAKAVLKQMHETAFAGLTRKEQKRFVEYASRVIATLKGDDAAAPRMSDDA